MDILEKTFSIPPELEGVASVLEATGFEEKSRLALLAFALGKDLGHDSSFPQYEEEYQDYYVQRRQAEHTFETALRKYLERRGPHMELCSWEMDYGAGCITVCGREARDDRA